MGTPGQGPGGPEPESAGPTGGADATPGQPPAAMPPAPGWWLASDGRWYPPTSESQQFGAPLAPQLPKKSTWSDRRWLLVGIGVVIVAAVAISMVLLGGDDDDASGASEEEGAVVEESTTTVTEPVATTTSDVEITTSTSALGAFDVGDVIVDVNLVVAGMCVNESNFSDPAAQFIGVITLMDCSQPHNAEVFLVFDLSAEAGAPFPGDQQLLDQADQGCIDAFAGYIGIDYFESELEVGFLYPSERTWRRDDDRRVICYVYDPDLENLTGSVAGSGI